MKNNNGSPNDKKLLSDLGERKFLDMISSFVDNSELPFNDDASAIKLNDKEVLVINIDMLVKSTDVPPGMTPKQIGKKAITMAVSDIIAKAATPKYCMVSIAIPKNSQIEMLQEIFHGIREQCNYFQCKFIGGDLNEGSELILDVVALGLCEKDRLLPRTGIEDGDILYVTDLFGLTTIGLMMVLKGLKLPKIFELNNKEILETVYNPIARLEFLPLLQTDLVKASMDSSDGLGASLYDLMKINNIGVIIENVPIHPIVQGIAESLGLNPLELVFSGGEEFSLLLIIPGEKTDQFEEKANELGLQVFRVGYFTKGVKGIKIADHRLSKYNIPKWGGYDHFLV